MQSCYNGFRKGIEMDEEQKDIQWHPAFVSAMNLEFTENRADLVFEREYNLNTKPLEIDLLIIKKEKDIDICNEIGYFFRKYNILEYKAPGDRLDVDSYYKAVAYGCLYKAYGNTVDGRKADDITVSLLRNARPDGLFQYFAEAGTDIRETYPGIYYLEGMKILFPTQVVVIKELEEVEHAYLRFLTFKSLSGKAEREYAASIPEVFTEANRKWVERWKGEDGMGPVLMEIMEPELQEAKNKGREEGREEGIHGAVDILQGLGYSSAKIKEIVMKRYCLSEKETAKFL